AEHLALRQVQIDGRPHHLAAIANAQLARLQNAHDDRPVRASNNRKHGAPTNAVTTPSGSSIPATLRARVSVSNRNAAPNSRLTGNSRETSAPTSKRATCGTIRPTQPM